MTIKFSYSLTPDLIYNQMGDLDDVKYRHALLNPKDDGSIVDIGGITDEFRQSHSFYCPYCKERMSSALGDKYVHHFKHYANGEGNSKGCNHESVLHAIAKCVFKKEFETCLNDGKPFILVATIPVKCNDNCVLMEHKNCNEHYINREIDLTKYFNKCDIERVSYLLDERFRRPDILLSSNDGKSLWVEIWVSHKTTNEKLKDGPILEIKIDSEDDLIQIKEHRIIATNRNSKACLHNPEVFKDVTANDDISVMPCDEYCILDYDERASLISRSFSKSFEKQSSSFYRLVVKLNWSGAHFDVWELGKKYKTNIFQENCDKRARSRIIAGSRSYTDPEFEKLIKFESEVKAITVDSTVEKKSSFGIGICADDEEKKKAIIKGLNPAQIEAVEQTSGPILIVAGAGSGKTKVLTSKVAWLLASGVNPQRVLALTFTKKAAEEMKERIALIVGKRVARGVVMGTFHSVFIRFLRDYALNLDYPTEFTVYDRSDSESAIKTCIKELNLDEKVYKPREVLSRISIAKNWLIGAEEYKAKSELRDADEQNKRPFLWKIFEEYQNKLKDNGVMDFDDILLKIYILLRDFPSAYEEIASRFDYILVDEYQDTNYVQYLILKKLATPHRNICVVGDDSQSIYAFRGAQIRNILNFKKDYPESKIIRLEQNYRSTKNIVNAANSVIEHNEGRIPKTCFSEGDEGEKIELIKAYTEQEEAMLIVSDIQDRMRTDHAQYEDFAILYRTNAQSRAIEEQLRRKNIPYIIYSGNSFFERAEVKDMMAWFKLCANLNDDVSFKRAVGKPTRGIGDTSISGLEKLKKERGLESLYKAAECDDFQSYLQPAAMNRIREFCRLIHKISDAALTTDAFDLAKQIYEESGLYAFFKSDTSIEGMARTANLDELLNSVQAFKEERLDEIMEDMDSDPDDRISIPTITLADFLETISLLSNADTEDNDDNGSNKVALMTVHSAKGLEFPYVFIAGAEENLFPGSISISKQSDIEEERRLFYVALTRAKKAVKVSFAQTRMRNGQHESNPPSRFVREIDERYVENPISEDSFGFDEDSSMFRRFGFGGNGGGLSTRTTGRATSGGYSSQTTGSGFKKGSFGNYRYGESSKVDYFRRKASEAPAQRGPFGTGNAPRGTQQGPLPGTGAGRGPIPTVKPPVIDANFVPEPMTSFRVGQRIEHNRFGAGTVVDITGVVPELKATIDFDNYGRKLLLLKYAKMRQEKK